MSVILQINTVVNSGSTGKIAEEIGKLLIKHKNVSYIAYGRNIRPSNSKLFYFGNKLDFCIHALLTRFFDLHGCGSVLQTIKLIRRIKSIKPDIIHLHNIHGYYLNYPLFFKFLKVINKPIIWTLHDCWAFTGHCSYYLSINCNKWKTGCYQCQLKHSYPKAILFDNSWFNYVLKKNYFSTITNLTLITPSVWLNNQIKDSFLSSYPSMVINNGINLSIFTPLSSKFRDDNNLKDKFIILGVASVWDERKGLKDFLHLSKHFDCNTVIILVGLSKKQITYMPSSIICIERTESQRELAQLYSTADVFINPTYEDNFPTTNIESLACGTPVITYNTGGSVEIIDDETGFVVERGNIEQLISKILSFKKIGKSYYFQKCVDRAKKLYNAEDRFNDYINVYNNLLSGQKK